MPDIPTIFGLNPFYNWKPVLGTNLLEVSVERDLGAPKGLRSPVIEKIS